MGRGDRAKRIVAGIYSVAADRLYEPLVVNGAFKLFGGNLNELALAQGRRAVEIADGAPILDMPVGTAFFTVKVAAAHGGIVVGADIATGMVDRARTAAVEAGTANLVPVQADAHHLPFADGAFGAILCTNGLQVIPGLHPAIAELARALRPGGTLFVSLLTLPAPRQVRRARRDRLPTMMWAGEEVAGVIAEHGLTIVSTRKERLATLIEATRAG